MTRCFGHLFRLVAMAGMALAIGCRDDARPAEIPTARQQSLNLQYLVPPGATWKYLDTGTDLGERWRARAFDDSAWPSGPAQLGYGDGDEATTVKFGPNPVLKFVTTYFRRSFTLDNPGGLVNMAARLLVDDGAIVYLNGTEVIRANMPEGKVDASTLAIDAVENVFHYSALDPRLLLAGTNELAVEVHQSAPDSTDLSFDLDLRASDQPLVLRGPYLQMGTPSQATIRWRTDVPCVGQVRFGTTFETPGGTSHESAPVVDHELRLTGLLAGTKYFYAIETLTTALQAPDPDQFFVTAPAPTSPRPVRVWAIGDAGRGDASAFAVRDAYLKFAGSRYTDVWLTMGDNAYPAGKDSEYQRALYDTFPTMLRQSFLWPTIGNHETDQQMMLAEFPYLDMFTLPTNGEAGGLPSGSERYYAFDYGNIHFISLDSMSSTRLPGSPMLTWLQNDLQSNMKMWTVVYFHHPPYSKGSHDSDAEIELIEMRENVVPILEKAGVDLVLSGHSHVFERTHLMDGHYGDSSTFLPTMNRDYGDGRLTGNGAYVKATPGPGAHEGTVYVVAGSAALVSPGAPLNHPAVFVALNQLGSMVLDIDANQLDATFLQNDGTAADHFTMRKGVPPLVTPPTAPAALAAAATSGRRIHLTWTDNAQGETSYQVERSADGVAFVPLATIGANATFYLDIPPLAGANYTYRVRAAGSGGLSGYSNAVSIQARECVPQKETCDGLDNNCDGLVDESFLDKGSPCSSGVGECARPGVRVCTPDGTGTLCGAVPGTAGLEICADNKDNNCNGLVDENCSDAAPRGRGNPMPVEDARLDRGDPGGSLGVESGREGGGSPREEGGVTASTVLDAGTGEGSSGAAGCQFARHTSRADDSGLALAGMCIWACWGLARRRRRSRLRSGLFFVASLAICDTRGIAAASPNPLRTATPIKNLVVLYQENVSFDHYFATYPHALNRPGEPAFVAKAGTPTVNGLTPRLLDENPNRSNPVRLGPGQAFTCDQNHGYKAEQNAYHTGLMDRFVEATGGRARGCDPNMVLSYFDGNTVTALWNYAQNFALSDNSYGSVFGPSLPGHINLVSGQTHGVDSIDRKGVVAGGSVIGDPDPRDDDCATGKERLSMTGRNVGDLLNEHGITWGYFQGGFRATSRENGRARCATTHPNLRGARLRDYVPHHAPFQYYPATANPHHLPPSRPEAVGRTDEANHLYDLQDFWAAAAVGNVPAVAILKPPAYQDGHAGYSDPLTEQRFLVETINRLQRLPQWTTMAIVIAYDDSDGWYDHVMPAISSPSATAEDSLTGPGQCGATGPGDRYGGRCGPGPRLPLLVISPFARVNHVDHTPTEQVSLLRFIEDNWHLGRLGDQSFDERAGLLDGLFDFARQGSKGMVPPLFLNPGTGSVVP